MGGNPYLERIDHLRALAVISVAIFEFRNLSKIEPIPEWFRIPIFEHGQTGVTLFMVISGFIFAEIASRGKINTKQFYLNRILRIYPLFITVVALGYFVTPDPRTTQAGLDFLMSLLPVSNLYRLNYGQFGGMFWSIAVELQFYLLFPFLWKYIRTWKGALSIIGLLIIIRVLAYLASGASYHFVYFTIFGSLDLFIIGILAQKFYSNNKSTISFLYAISFGLLAITITSWEINIKQTSPFWIISNTLLALAYSGLLIAYLRANRQIIFGGFFSLVGRVSYSIYVWQIFIYYAVINFIPKEIMGGYQWGILIFLLVVLPFSILSYHFLEKPFLNLRKIYIN